VRYKGEVKEGYRITQLFDYCELNTAQQTPGGLSLLVSPVPDPDHSPERSAMDPNAISLPSEGFQEGPPSSEAEREASRRAAEPYKGGTTPY